MNNIHESTKFILKNALNENESIIWAETPGTSQFQKLSIFYSIFSIPFTAFSIFWIYMALSISSKAPSAISYIFPIFGIPFVVIGLLAFLSPLWAAFARKRSACIITDQRVVVLINKVFSSSLYSYERSNLKIIQKVIRGNGSGDLIFEERFIFPQSPLPIKIGFLGIKEPNKIERLIKDQS